MEHQYVNTTEFDVDLHSIYAAYMGVFDTAGTEWWDRSWAGYFNSFDDFLSFSWEAVVAVDAYSGKGQVAVRREQIALFTRMIRTRFGESLPKEPSTMIILRPVTTTSLAQRRLTVVKDLSTYRKLAQTIQAAELAHLRVRLRHAEIEVIEQLFDADGTRHTGVHDNGVGYTWAAINTLWWEKGGPPSGLIPGAGHTRGKGTGTILEIGMAALRCAHLRAAGVWPPDPQYNYRKSHFVVQEWVDKRRNTAPPNRPRSYGFGQSRFVAERDVERILDASLSGLASQENDGNSNMLIIVTAGEPQPLPVPAGTTLPNNILYVDVLNLEHSLLRRGAQAGTVHDREHPLPNLASLLQAISIPVLPHIPLGNAGNDAFYTLLAFQKLLMVDTRLPDVLTKPPMDYRHSTIVPGSLPGTHSPIFSRQRAYSRRKAQTVFWDDAKYKPPSGNHSNSDFHMVHTPRRVSSGPITPLLTQPSIQSTDEPVNRPKLNHNRSVKDIAGALANFWIG